MSDTLELYVFVAHTWHSSGVKQHLERVVGANCSYLKGSIEILNFVCNTRYSKLSAMISLSKKDIYAFKLLDDGWYGYELRLSP